MERRPTTGTNVGDAERWISALGGAALVGFGLSRRSLGGAALAALGGSLLWRGATGHCGLYNALGVNTAVARGSATSVPAGHGIKVVEGVTINRPAADLYRFWRNLDNLGRFMEHLESVHVEGNRSHWVACGPLGARVEWDAEIITDRPNELIGWRSLPGSDVDTAGSVHFRQLGHDRGTEVQVELKYDPPAGKAGAAIARLFGRSPQQQIREDLRRLKQFMETGEVPTTAGQPRGTCP
jgi:uncharacterized membrane protein